MWFAWQVAQLYDRPIAQAPGRWASHGPQATSHGAKEHRVYASASWILLLGISMKCLGVQLFIPTSPTCRVGQRLILHYAFAEQICFCICNYASHYSFLPCTYPVVRRVNFMFGTKSSSVDHVKSCLLGCLLLCPSRCQL